MTDIQHIDVDSDEFEGTPRALRDHVKRLQKALTEKDQVISGFQSERADTALADVLAGFRNPKRVKSDLLSDGIDPLDSEAVKTWMESNGDDYARGEAPADPPQNESEQDPEVPDYSRIHGVEQIGTPAGSDRLTLLNAMPEGLNRKEAHEWLVKQGF